MASEYLKWKYRDVKPNAPPPPLTRKERVINWLHYNKWWIVVWVAVIGITGSIVWNALGIGQVRPDYIFAYIGADGLSEDCAAALEAGLSSLGADVNGDGRVAVELRQYATARSGDAETALYFNYAADVALVADITAAESYFFLVEDPDSVQKAYQIFAEADGTPPAEEDPDGRGKVLRWGDCPALAGLAADQEQLGDLYLGRRCFYDGKQAEEQEANAAFWDVITKGARG